MSLYECESNKSDATLEASARTASSTLKELRKDINLNSYNQHILMAALIIADQIKGLNSVVNNISEKLLDIAESIDCVGAIPTDFWMQSDLAAIDKANELGISILPEYSMADLRYKIYCAINEVN